MYLENNLGMSVADQESTGVFRGSTADKLSNFSLSGTNSSGFSILLEGRRDTNGFFGTYRSDRTNFWTSTQSGSNAYRRVIYVTSSGVYRDNSSKSFAYSVRCLKD